MLFLSLFPIYILSYLFLYCMAYSEEKPELSSGLSLGLATGNVLETSELFCQKKKW